MGDEPGEKEKRKINKRLVTKDCLHTVSHVTQSRSFSFTLLGIVVTTNSFCSSAIYAGVFLFHFASTSNLEARGTREGAKPALVMLLFSLKKSLVWANIGGEMLPSLLRQRDLVATSQGEMLVEQHLFHGTKQAEKFCENGVEGGPCGNGICVDGIRCVCDEGYVHDSAFQYYPNCFTPEYLYPVTHAVVGILCLLAALAGIWVYMRIHPGPARRVVLGSIAFAAVYLATMVSHQLESRMGFVTEIFHGIAILVVFILIVPPSMDLYIHPAFQFSQSRAYARTKRILLYLFVTFTCVFTVISIEAQRKLAVDGNLKGYNDFRALAHFCMALFVLAVILSFTFAARKVITLLENVQRNHQNQAQARVQQTSGRDEVSLSEQAKIHIGRVRTTQSIVIPVMISALASDAILSGLHYYLGVFPYQYMFFIGLAWPVPIFCVALLWLVSDHMVPSGSSPPRAPLSNISGESSAQTVSSQGDSRPQAQGESQHSSGTLTHRAARRRPEHSSTDVNGMIRQADSGASGFSLTLE